MMRVLRCLHAGFVPVLFLVLAACSNGRGSLDDGGAGGGTGQQQPPGKVTVGGTIAGLSGSGLMLQNNGGDNLAVTANGAFTFKTSVDAGTTYNITVAAQPTAPSQFCSIANAAGTATNNVTTVTVNCSTGSFSVGGSVSGLAGSGLVLRNNGGDDLPIASNGSFTFATELASGAAFEVSVATQPTRPAQTCTVADASGTVGGGDVRTVKVSCATNSYTISGTVSGLQGSGLVLQNNGGDDVGVQTDGGFAFPTKIPSGSGYSVTVKTQPGAPAQSCSVQSGSGTVADRDVINVVITCALSTFTIGGTISNLQGSGMVLANNGGDRFSPSASGPFTFPTAMLAGSTYNVTVATLPSRPRQLCQVTNGVGTVPEANVTTVGVSCFVLPFGVGGTVSGLESPGLELQSNGEKLAIAANGKFMLPISLPEGSPYDVSVATQPANQVCSVANGRGAIDKDDVASVIVACKQATE
jgi:environmental stress-induced protein Ves